MASLVNPSTTPSKLVTIDQSKADAMITALSATVNKTVPTGADNSVSLLAIYQTIDTKGLLTPTSFNRYLDHFNLDDSGRKELADALNRNLTASGGTPVTTYNKDNIIPTLLKSEHIKNHFKTDRYVMNPRVPQVNPIKGLNLLLVNPQIAAAINDERKRRSKLIMARPIRGSSMGPFGALLGNSGLNFSVQFPRVGGAAMQPPSSEHPIEMRGGGYDIAMSGGQPLGFWTQPNDNFFISTQLKSALASLQATLKSQGKELADDTEQQIANLVKRLEDAENAVKAERDNLNRAVEAINSGDAKPIVSASGTASTIQNEKGADITVNTTRSGVTLDHIRTIAEKYNSANANRQSLENKLFRVIISLNGAQIYPRSG